MLISRIQGIAKIKASIVGSSCIWLAYVYMQKTTFDCQGGGSLDKKHVESYCSFTVLKSLTDNRNIWNNTLNLVMLLLVITTLQSIPVFMFTRTPQVSKLKLSLRVLITICLDILSLLLLTNSATFFFDLGFKFCRFYLALGDDPSGVHLPRQVQCTLEFVGPSGDKIINKLWCVYIVGAYTEKVMFLCWVAIVIGGVLPIAVSLWEIIKAVMRTKAKAQMLV